MSPAQVARVRRYKSATQSKRLGSFGVSVLLHASLLVAIIYAGNTAPRQFNLDAPMLNLTQLTIGASGPKPELQPEIGTRAAPPPPEPVAEEVIPVPKIEDVVEEPPVVEAAVPEETALEEVVPEEPAPEEAAPEEPVVEEVIPEPEPTPEELLAAAMAEAMAEAAPAPEASGGASLLDSALSDAGSSAESERIVTGQGGSGVGILALYEEVVAMQIRRHFVTHLYTDGRVYVVVILVEIAPNGSLQNVTIKEASGDPSLDAKVLRAVRDAGRFEPPPKGHPGKVLIPFSSDIYAGQ